MMDALTLQILLTSYLLNQLHLSL